MARPLDSFRSVGDGAAAAGSRRGSDRSTARALASAIAALAVATVVVSESTSALDPVGTASTNRFDSGTVSLVDDDSGRSLVDVTNMAPGRPVEACITVTYDGSILPVDVTLSAETSGDVVDFLEVRVERGRAADFGTCEGFVAGGEVFAGRVSELADGAGVDVGVVRSARESIGFRFTFELADDAAAAGRSGSLDLVWEAVP